MSPKNIINKAIEKNLDIIALTDHNSCENCEVAMELGKENDIIVIPGMEVTVQEEFHVVTLFKDLDNCKSLSEKIYNSLLPIDIDEDKIGYQIVVDKEENIIRLEKRVLNQASLGIDEIIDFTNKNDGIVFFSHIDKLYFSLIGTLGFIPPKYSDMIFEITKDDDFGMKKIIKNSDAHVIQDVGHRYFNLRSNKDINDIFNALKQGEFYI